MIDRLVRRKSAALNQLLDQGVISREAKHFLPAQKVDARVPDVSPDRKQSVRRVPYQERGEGRAHSFHRFPARAAFLENGPVHILDRIEERRLRRRGRSNRAEKLRKARSRK